MALRYQISAEGLNEVPYRVDIYDANYGGASIEGTLGDAENFLYFDGGERGSTIQFPIHPRVLHLNVIQTTDLSPLFGAEDKDIRVEVFRTDTSTLTYLGYLKTNYYTDKPLGLQPDVVQLRATEGIPTLKSLTFNDLFQSGQDTASVLSVVSSILAEVYPNDVLQEYNAGWYPYVSGSQISASTLPLDNIRFFTNNYREDRAQPDEGEWLNLYETLKDLLTSFGLVIRQRPRDGSDLVWHVRQRGQIDPATGEIKIWLYDRDGTTLTLQTGYPQLLDLSKTVSSDYSGDVVVTNHERTFERRWESVERIHDHVSLEQVLLEGGFEATNVSAPTNSYPNDNWTINTGSYWVGTHQEHDNVSETPAGTTNDTYLLTGNYEQPPSNEQLVWYAEQSVGEIEPVERGTYGRISMEIGGNVSDVSGVEKRWPGYIGLQVDDDSGSWYLTWDTVQVAKDVNSGETFIPVQSGTVAPIPKGARLLINNRFFQPGGGKTIDITERVDRGAQTLRGTLSDNLEQGERIYYVYFDNSATMDSPEDIPVTTIATSVFTWAVLPRETVKEEFFSSCEFRFAWEGKDGTRISGPTTLRLGNYTLDLGTSDPGQDWFVYSNFDDVTLSLERDGSPLDEKVTTTSVPETGKAVEVETRIGDGPTGNNLSRLQAVGSGGSPVVQASDWKDGAYSAGESASGKSLEQLHGEQWLKMFRDHTDRMPTQFVVESKFTLDGSEVLILDSTAYTIQRNQENPGPGTIDTELLKLEQYTL